jgi:hypothetical protein
MASQLIFVNDRPYRVLSQASIFQAQDLVRGIDPTYHLRLARLLEPALIGDDANAATLGLRTIHGQAVEAFFGLLFALLQAPTAPAAWLLLYRPADLRVLVKKVHEGAEFPTRFELNTRDWKGVATALIPGEDDDSVEAVERFSAFWSHIAEEFRHPRAVDEYNSLKHGLRARFASPWLEVGGHQVKAAEHGSWFPIVSCRGSDVLVGLGCRSWSAQSLVGELQLIASSIRNVVAVLKMAHGIGEPGRLEMEIPSEEEVAAARPPRTQTLAALGLTTNWPEGWKAHTLDRKKALEEYGRLGPMKLQVGDAESIE